MDELIEQRRKGVPEDGEWREQGTKFNFWVKSSGDLIVQLAN